MAMNDPLQISYDMISVDSRDDANTEENVNMLQKKIKQLINARMQDKQRIESLTHQNELFKLELEEKERTCIKLHKEVDLLQQKLFSEKLKTEPKNQEKMGSTTSIKLLAAERRAISMSNTSFLVPKFMLNPETTATSITKTVREDEEIVSRLSEEVKYFKKQHELLAQKLTKSEQAFFEQKSQIMDLELRNKRLENEINKQKELMIQMKKSLDANMKLSKEIEICRMKIQNLEKTNSMLENNNNDLNRLLLSKNQNINDLEELSQLARNQLHEFSAALVLQIEEKNKIAHNCQMFRLNRIGNLGSLLMVPTLLLIRRDLNYEYILELENYFSKIVLKARDIIELSICKENRTKFYILYRIPKEQGSISEKEEFESEEPVSVVCKAIKEFLERAEEYENQHREDERKAESSLNRRGFFSDLVNFFS